MKLVHDIFFLDSLTFKIWKNCVTNIINVLDIILKKMQNIGTLVARVKIIADETVIGVLKHI